MCEEIKKKEKELIDEMIDASRFYRSERLDMSIGEIVNLFREKEIIIDPEFQRAFRWGNNQQTKLIESILIGIPIPPIFVVENDNGKWEVIDGLQRLSTIISFMGYLNDKDKDNWTLREGDILKTIKNLSYEELPTRAKIKIKRYIFRIEIISDESDYNIRYDLFERLNTGGANLKDQEIRNVIFRHISPNFNNFLKEEGQSHKFLDLIKISEKKEKQLFAEELVLRFCSLYNDDKIKDTLSKHMTSFMKKFVNETAEDTNKITAMQHIFESTIDLLNEVNEDKIFLPESKKGGFSTSVYDGIMYGLAKNIKLYKDKNPDILLDKINELKKNEKFKRNMGSQSHNPKRVMARKNISNEIFRNID